MDLIEIMRRLSVFNGVTGSIVKNEKYFLGKYFFRNECSNWS